jgi:hypothetical protein
MHGQYWLTTAEGLLDSDGALDDRRVGKIERDGTSLMAIVGSTEVVGDS